MKFNCIPELSNCLFLAFFSLSINSMAFSNDGLECGYFKGGKKCFELKVECSKLEAEEERDKCYKLMEQLKAELRFSEQKAEQNYKKKLKEEMEQYKREHEEKLLEEKREEEKRAKKDSVAYGAGLVTAMVLVPFISPFGAALIGHCAQNIVRNSMSDEDDS